MNTPSTVFAQIMAFLPMHEFRKCVRRYRGDYKVKRFSCLDQFLCLAFAQLTYREILRDIVSCLRTMKNRLYHMGIRSPVSRNNLAHANEMRDWRIYADFAHVLIAEARTLYRDEDIGLDLQNTVYAFDSTTIDLCLSLFPWAFFRKRKGAIKCGASRAGGFLLSPDHSHGLPGLFLRIHSIRSLRRPVTTQIIAAPNVEGATFLPNR